MTDLSPRELEVLKLLAAGKRNKEIAAELGIGTSTIGQFKLRAAEKLGLDHPTDVALVNAARDAGVLLNPAPGPQTKFMNAPLLLTSQAAPTMPADLFEISAEYPGKFTERDWLRAEPNIRARIADGETAQRLRAAAIMYRRQHSALQGRAYEAAAAREIPKHRAEVIAVTHPEKFYDYDGPWRGRFPMPAYVEIPPEPIGNEEPNP